MNWITERVGPLVTGMGENLHAIVRLPVDNVSRAIQWLDRQVVDLTKRLSPSLSVAAVTLFRSSPFLAARLLLPTTLCVTLVVCAIAYVSFTNKPLSNLKYIFCGTALGCLCCTPLNLAQMIGSIHSPWNCLKACCTLINNVAIALFLRAAVPPLTPKPEEAVSQVYAGLRPENLQKC